MSSPTHLYIQVLEIVCELTQFESLESVINKTVEAFGALDFLVNNAGSGVMGPVEKVSDTFEFS